MPLPLPLPEEIADGLFIANLRASRMGKTLT